MQRSRIDIEFQEKIVEAQKAIIMGKSRKLQTILQSEYKEAKLKEANFLDLIEGKGGYRFSEKKKYFQSYEITQLLEYALKQEKPNATIVNLLIKHGASISIQSLLEYSDRQPSPNAKVSLLLIEHFLTQQLNNIQNERGYRAEPKDVLKVLTNMGQSLNNRPEHDSFLQMKDTFLWEAGGQFRKEATDAILKTADEAIQKNNIEKLKELLNRTYKIQETYTYKGPPDDTSDYDAEDVVHVGKRFVSKQCIELSAHGDKLLKEAKKTDNTAIKLHLFQIMLDHQLSNKQTIIPLINDAKASLGIDFQTFVEETKSKIFNQSDVETIESLDKYYKFSDQQFLKSLDLRSLQLSTPKQNFVKKNMANEEQAEKINSDYIKLVDEIIQTITQINQEAQDKKASTFFVSNSRSLLTNNLLTTVQKIDSENLTSIEKVIKMAEAMMDIYNKLCTKVNNSVTQRRSTTAEKILYKLEDLRNQGVINIQYNLGDYRMRPIKVTANSVLESHKKILEKFPPKDSRQSLKM